MTILLSKYEKIINQLLDPRLFNLKNCAFENDVCYGYKEDLNDDPKVFEAFNAKFIGNEIYIPKNVRFEIKLDNDNNEYYFIITKDGYSLGFSNLNDIEITIELSETSEMLKSCANTLGINFNNLFEYIIANKL